MPATGEVLDEIDVIEMELETLKNTTRAFDVDHDELAEKIPTMEHHMTVRGKLDALMDQDVLSTQKAESVYERWNERKGS
jgi:hypothetical protein